MNPKSLFRLLIVVTMVSAIGGALAAVFPGNISEDWRTISEWSGNGGIYERVGSPELLDKESAPYAVIGLLVALILFLLSISVGLFLFWRVARLANLLVSVAFLLLAPWEGLVVLLPLEAAFYNFTTLCEGAVIALSYVSPVKDYFETKQINRP